MRPCTITFQHMYELDGQSCISKSLWSIHTDLIFAEESVIFPESLKLFVMALEKLHKEAKPLGRQVS